MINNNKKTTILITSIMLTSILVIGIMDNAYGFGTHADTHPFPNTPTLSNINVASLQVGSAAKATADPPTTVPILVSVSNVSAPPNIPREQVLRLVGCRWPTSTPTAPAT